MKKVSITLKEQTEKKDAKNIENELLIHRNQISFVNQLLLEEEFCEKKQIDREIKKKISGYKNQDIKKELYNSSLFINYEEIIELLVKSKLICHYCGLKVFVLYKNQKDPKQWTLDRIDNEKGHNKDNLVISCLDCNIRRGRLNKDKFLFTKRMKITKSYD